MPDVELIVSLPPLLVNESPFFQPSPSNSSPTTPPVHITHDTTGWNWIHASTGDAYYTSPATGHFLDEDWPKIVPLNANSFRSRSGVYEVSDPQRTFDQRRFGHELWTSICLLRSNLLYLTSRLDGVRVAPVRLVRLKDQLPEPIFHHSFLQYAMYKELELDLLEKRTNGT